jgi:F-type H+-transporting ATPase subunit c
MNSKFFSLLMIAMILLGFASMGFAATDTGSAAGTSGVSMLSDIGAGRLGGPIGAGLVLIGGGLGIGKVSASACEAIARQPEAGGRIFTTMIIGAAMIEGTTLFGVIVCLLPIIK